MNSMSHLMLKGIPRVTSEIVIVQNDNLIWENTNGLQNRVNIYYCPFENDFSKLRNFGVNKATGKWIFVLDSDEELSTDLVTAIPTLLKDSTVDGYWFRRKTFITKDRYLRYGFFYPDYQLRLFRNKKEYRYIGAVHEQLTIPKQKTKEMSLDILHFPTNPKYTSWLDFKNMLPYIRIQAAGLQTQQRSIAQLFWLGCTSFWILMFNGFIRGKGFLDGYAGFRAQVLFSLSIASGYILAGFRKLS